MDNEKTIAEINEVIAKVEAGLEPNCEIGARDKMTLKGLLKANNIDKDVKFFPCKRENSAKIIAHFVRVKGIPQSRFSINAQPGIFILCEAGGERKVQVQKEEKAPKEAKVLQEGKTPKEAKVLQEGKTSKEAKVKGEKAPRTVQVQKEQKSRKEVKDLKGKKAREEEKTQKKGTGKKTKAAKKGKRK